MRLLRWLRLVPAAAPVPCPMLMAGIGARHRVEQHLGPVASVDHGICRRTGMGWVLRGIRLGSVALAVLATGVVAMALAPVHLQVMLWAGPATCLALADAAANASAWFTVAAALAGAAAGAARQYRCLASRPVGTASALS